MTLAVAVCSRDRTDQLSRCLEALRDQDADEVLVVDSASSTAATEKVARIAGVNCIRADTPGLAHARNVAVRATTADVIAFTDDDCVPEAGWAAAIRSQFAEGGADRAPEPDRLGFVVGRVVAAGDGEPISLMIDVVPATYGRDDDPSHIGHGANLAVSRACWECLNGFDDLLGAGSRLRSGEDTDFLWRALRQGWAGHYVPAAVVAHAQWRDRRTALRTSYGYGIGAGAVRSKVRRLGGPTATQRFAAGSVGATLRQAGTDLRAGYEFGVATSLVRAAGLVVGRARASRLPLIHGHLAAR
jgi:glycosyltransferase involved in cell wall biosynthesis